MGRNIWNSEMDARLSEIYVSKGKLAAMQELSMREGQIRARASFLKLKARGVSEAWYASQVANGKKRAGIKRPEHAELMRKMKKEGRILNISAETSKLVGKKVKAYQEIHGHPRGALGMKHSEEAKARISKSSKESWRKKTEEEKADWVMKGVKTRAANGTSVRQRPEATWKAAWREFGGRRVFYRSRWEANYGRYLEWLKCHGHIKEWEHEPKTFWFEGIKRGCVSYLPDFRVTENDGRQEYHEVKGWMDARSKTKIARMAKYHPSVVLIVIAKKEYTEIEKKVSSLIDGWEYSK